MMGDNFKKSLFPSLVAGPGRWRVQDDTVYEGGFAQHLRHGHGSESFMSEDDV